MAVVNAHTGSFSFYLTEDDFDAEDLTTVDTASWFGDWTCSYVPVTPAASGSGRLYLAELGEAKWSVSAPLDDTFPPEVLGLEEGTVIYQALFNRGDSGTADQVDRTTLVSIQVLNNNTGDATRVVLTGMGGRVTEGV